MRKVSIGKKVITLKNFFDYEEIEPIADEEKARLLKIIDKLCSKWDKKKIPEKEVWDKQTGWPAKLVSTEFTLGGMKFELYPGSIGLCRNTDDPLRNAYDAGFYETLSLRIEKDLEKLGAENIFSLGCID